MHTRSFMCIHRSCLDVNCPDASKGINACARPTERTALCWWRRNAASANLTHNCNFQMGILILLNATSYKYPFCILVCISHHYASSTVSGMLWDVFVTFIINVEGYKICLKCDWRVKITIFGISYKQILCNKNNIFGGVVRIQKFAIIRLFKLNFAFVVLS